MFTKNKRSLQMCQFSWSCVVNKISHTQNTSFLKQTPNVWKQSQLSETQWRISSTLEIHDFVQHIPLANTVKQSIVSIRHT